MKRKRFTKEFNLEALCLLEQGDKRGAVLARELGVRRNQLYKWRREIEILALLADKTSTQDIATTLSISIRTVRTHIQHLMYKLQVHKLIEAVEVGKRLKLI